MAAGKDEGKGPKLRAGRKFYIENLVRDLVRGGEAIGLSEDAKRALVIGALQHDARIGGKVGRTMAEIVDMCIAALNTAGVPTDRENVIRTLADPKAYAAAHHELTQLTDPKRKK